MRRDALLLIGLFVLLAVFIALGPARVASTPGSSASSHASGEGGALAIYRWLEALGYRAERLQNSAFAPDPTAGLLIVLAPTERFERDQAAAVEAWVAAGGTLLVAEPSPGAFSATSNLLDAFALTIEPLPGAQPYAAESPVLQPVLAAPPARLLRTETASRVGGERDDLALLAGDEAWPTLVGVQHGEGYVFASSAVYPFTNAGLAEADNAAMLLNLLRRVPPGALVQFDEYHHGFVGQPSLRALLLGTRWGWAALYLAGVLALYLALTGRRFGVAVPLREETGRRSSGEYLESMAGLLRRAGKADFARDHIRATLKRRLARAYGLNPQQEDAPFLAALADASPATAQAAGTLLARLHQPADEQALLRLLVEADRLTEARA